MSDLDLGRLEALVRSAVPEQYRERVKLERYDATGSYVAFAAGVKSAVAAATDEIAAERALLTFVQSYDVAAGSAGLSAREEKPELAISAMLLSELGRAYQPCVRAALESRGFSAALVDMPRLLHALTFLRCLVAQHHIQALLRRAKSAALISAVSQVELVGPAPKKGGGSGPHDGQAPEPQDLLEVERLVERLPQIAEVKAQQSWEWRQDLSAGAEKRSLLTLVEAVFL